MKNKKTLLIFIFIVLALLLLLNLYLPNILDLFKSQGPESNKISVSPELVEKQENIYSVDINFRTLDDSGILNKTSAVSFSLTYPKDPNNNVEVVNMDGLLVYSVEAGEEINEENEWRVPINEVKRTDKGVQVDFAAVNVSTTGFTSANGTTLAKIYFKAQEPLIEDSFILNFYSDNTIILTKTAPTKNIRGDESDLYYSVNE